MFTIHSKRHLLTAIIVFLLLGGWVRAQEKTSPTEKQPAAKDPEKLQALLKERRDEAQKVVDVFLVRVKGGQAVPDINLLESSRVLLQAELDLVDKPNERIGLHENYVERAKELQDFAKRMNEAGRTDPAVYPGIQAFRCEAELGLLRERADDKPSAKQAEEIKKLLIERRDALRNAVKIYEIKVQAGSMIYDSNYHKLSRQLARVEVELARDPMERIAAREDYVKRAKECEKITAAQAKAGKADPTIAPSAQASRCDAEIEFLKDRSGDKPSAEQATEIKKLLDERRDALRKEFEIRKRNPAVDLTMLDTIPRLLRAELELVDRSEQRISLFEKHLKDLQEIEKEAPTKPGRVDPVISPQMKVGRLDMEISVLRERRKANPPEEMSLDQSLSSCAETTRSGGCRALAGRNLLRWKILLTGSPWRCGTGH